MKMIFLLALVMIVCSSFGQSLRFADSLFGIIECGTWVADSMRYTEWETVDTISVEAEKRNLRLTKTEQRDWIYGREIMDSRNWTYADWSPCGRGDTKMWRQYRLCRITGIRQVRTRYQTYHYVPPPISDYQKAEDSLKRKTGWLPPAERFNKNVTGDSILPIKASSDPESRVLKFEY